MRGLIGEARRSREDARASAVEALRRARDFVRRTDRMRERFPDARLCDVEELAKLFERGEVEVARLESHARPLCRASHPRRRTGFSTSRRRLGPSTSIIKKLNEEAAELAARIARKLREIEGMNWPQTGPSGHCPSRKAGQLFLDLSAQTSRSKILLWTRAFQSFGETTLPKGKPNSLTTDLHTVTEAKAAEFRNCMAVI